MHFILICVGYFLILPIDFVRLGASPNGHPPKCQENFAKNSGFFGIVAIYNAVLFTMKGIKLKDRNKLITGIIWSVLAVGLAVEYFYRLITTAGIL